MTRIAVAFAFAVLVLAPSLLPGLPTEAPRAEAGRAEPAPPWAVGCRWKWVADQSVSFCMTLGQATIRINRITGDMVDRVVDLTHENGTDVYLVDVQYSEALTGTLTILGFPTPIVWPVTGNGTFLYRIPDLALVYSYQHIVIDMGTLGTFTFDTSTSASPPVESYRFPLSVGDGWVIRSDLTVWSKTGGVGGAYETTSNDQVDLNASVPLTEDAAVPAGALSCYNLTYNGTYTTGSGSPSPQVGSALYSPKATNLAFRSFSPMAGLNVVFALSEYSLNHAPAVASPVPQAGFPEDTVGSLDLYTVFSDPDAGDILGFSAGNFTNITTSVDNSTGIATFRPPANWSGSERMVFTATDGKGARARTEVNVTVTPVDDAPVLLRPLPGIIMNEDTVNDTLDLSQHFDDADFPYGDSLWFTFTDNGSVAVDISQKGIVKLRPFENHSGVQNLTIIATDAAGAWTGGPLKVAVLNTPDAPVVVDGSHDLTMPEDTQLVVDLSARFYDADVPYGDLLTFSVEDVTAGFDHSLDDRTGRLELFPPKDWNGATALAFVATDGTGQNATERVRLTVSPVNDAPRLLGFSPSNESVTIPENAATSFSVAVDDMDSPALNVSWLADGRQGTVGRNFTYVADFYSAGSHNVTMMASDGEYQVVQTWNLTVANVNRPPAAPGISSPANGSRFTWGERVNFSAAGTDPDNDTLTFTWKDTGGKVLSTGRAFGTKSLSKGKHVVKLEVSDGNATVTASVALSVSPPPEQGTPGFGAMALAAALLLALLPARRGRRHGGFAHNLEKH